jgi:hypothetical protein
LTFLIDVNKHLIINRKSSPAPVAIEGGSIRPEEEK